MTERVRRQEIQYQPGRAIEMIVGEAALRSVPGTAGTQLDRLVALAGLATVDLGIAAFQVAPPPHCTGDEQPAPTRAVMAEARLGPSVLVVKARNHLHLGCDDSGKMSAARPPAPRAHRHCPLFGHRQSRRM